MAPSKDNKCRINRKLAPVKATYFFELGAVASLLPYLTVYMKTIGLTYSEISIIYGTMPFVAAVLRMPVGMLADKLQKHRLLLLLCCVFSGVFHGALLMTPRSAEGTQEYAVCQAPVSVRCHGSDSWLDLCHGHHGNGTDVLCVGGQKDCSARSTQMFTNASMCTMQCTREKGYCIVARTSHLYVEPCTQSDSTVTDTTFTADHITNTEITYGRDQAQCSRYTLSAVRYEDTMTAGFSCPADSQLHLSNCTMTCELTTPPQNATSCSDFQDSTSQTQPYQTTFWYMFILFLLGQVFFSPIFSLIDAMVYDHLGTDAGQWGYQRLWGTVGFGVFAVISGLMMDTFADLELSTDGSNFIYAFVAFAVLSIVGGLMVLFYKISPNITSTRMLSNLRDLFSRFEVIVLFVCIFLYGLYTGVIEVFLYVRLDELGASKVLMGLSMVINCLPEIGVLIFSGKIMKFCGYAMCLSFVFLAYAIRLVGYAFLKEPWFVLLLEPLHSITFGLMYATVTSYGNDITPDGMHGTIQSIIGALYFGFGKGVGGISSGQVYEAYGVKSMFLGYGISSVVFLVLYLVLYVSVIRRRHQATSRNREVLDVKDVETKMMSTASDHPADIEGEKDQAVEADGLVDQNHLTNNTKA